MAGINSKSSELPTKSVVYLFLVLGLAAITYGISTGSFLLFGIAILFPIGAMILYLALNRPIWSYVMYAIVTCYFSAIYRYANIENLSIILDIVLAIAFLSLAVNIINNRGSYPWSNAASTLNITYAVWLAYCFLSMFNPYATFDNLITARSVYLTLPLTYLISSVLLCTPYRLRVTLFLLAIFITTAFVKAYWQNQIGFDRTETIWLKAGGYRTHLLQSGIRYFSFYTDAGNFGASMGMFSITFGILSFVVKKKISRIFFLVTTLAALGMMLSGTRGAIIVPFGGLALYVILSKNFNSIVIGILVCLATYSFFNYTYIGQGNTFIRRMRTAFNPEKDGSFNVRLENQKIFAYYLKDKPFGVGIGGNIVDTKGLTGVKQEHMPTDSFYVDIWVQGGIVGLCLYITILIIVLLRCVYIIMFKIRNKQLARILGALLAGVFGIWLNGYVGRAMGFQPSTIVIAIFLSFVLNGEYMDQRLKEDEIIA